MKHVATSIFLTLLFVIPCAQGQSDVRRYELAFHTPVLHLGNFDTTDVGLGGKVTYNLNRWLALEAESNLFPKDQARLGGEKSQVLGGVKAGVRF